jgi:hypothetical protein
MAQCLVTFIEKARTKQNSIKPHSVQNQRLIVSA